MLNDTTVVNALEGATKYEAEVEGKQREWMMKNGIE